MSPSFNAKAAHLEQKDAKPQTAPPVDNPPNGGGGGGGGGQFAKGGEGGATRQQEAAATAGPESMPTGAMATDVAGALNPPARFLKILH